MENTGRISRSPLSSARRIVFGRSSDDALDAEMEHITQVDRAHVVMLAEGKIVDKGRARSLLSGIEQLRTCRFQPLRGRPAARGLYMLYEDYLIEKFGANVGGILQTGRSRNDLNATVFRLRLRKPYSRLLRACLGLQSNLLRGAAQFFDVVMPAYTHFQAAVPVTYGHYLAGVAAAFTRDVDWLLESAADAERCPLGAGAAGGTSWPIDPQRTAELLGFEKPAVNSIDAVASRDVVLRILAAAAVVGTTLSRLAADLLLWTTTEFGFLYLGDQLVGSSSMMPQKRNPFLLEHAQGRSAVALGAFTAAATSMHGTPFTNSIAVNTEAVSQFWKALRDTSESATLLRLVLRGAEPQREAMLQRTVEGQTVATEMANLLVARSGMPFRTAHRTVGAVLRDVNGSQPDSSMAGGLHETLSSLSPGAVVEASRFGGGPAPDSLAASLEKLRAGYEVQQKRLHWMMTKWRRSRMKLDEEVRKMVSAVAGSGKQTL